QNSGYRNLSTATLQPRSRPSGAPRGTAPRPTSRRASQGSPNRLCFNVIILTLGPLCVIPVTASALFARKVALHTRFDLWRRQWLAALDCRHPKKEKRAPWENVSETTG